jgi:DUF4097 and DUF4098 domain-containing protein YvlB
MLRSLAVMLILLLPGASAAETVSQEFDASGLDSLSVINTSGDINISVSTSGKALISARKIKFPVGCSLIMERSGGDLYVETSDPLKLDTNCRVHFEIAVPAAISLGIKNGSGDVEVKDTNGSLEFKLGSGDLKMAATVTDLNGTSGSGDVKVSGLTGNVNLKLGSGDIWLEYGATTVIFPEGSEILTDLTTGSGKIYNEIGDTAGAPFKVTVRSGSGKLSIKKAR